MTTDGPPVGGHPASVAGAPSGIAERTRLRRRAIVNVAQRLTAEHGLAGFTVEELCAEVGVSRRTFFNHFPSKEDAVVGIDLDTDAALLEEFAAGGLVPTGAGLVETLVAATIVHLERIGVTREQGRRFRAALEREPALLARALSAGEQQTRRLAEALRRREGLGPDDRSADVAVRVAGALIQLAAADYFSDSSDDRLEVLVAEHLRLAQAAIAPSAHDHLPEHDHLPDHDLESDS